jgi:regulator of sirC expression with transglutaminase-like and TPR domain
MFKQREAIIRLLMDEDQDTVNLTKQQLAEGGTETIPDLKDLLAIDDEKVTAHIREILSKIEVRQAKNAFAEVCLRISDFTDLEDACWQLAKIFLPGVEVENYVKQIDSWGAELRTRVWPSQTEIERVASMAQFFARELGFRGNSDDYYNAKNSFLPTVIDSKLGIPISLSLIYMIIARRAEIFVEGVNLPGHFVVRHGDVLFDPFHQGRILTTRDCADILTSQKLTLHMSHLETAAPKLILMRILANLSYIFENTDEEAHYQMVSEWIRLLDRK